MSDPAIRLARRAIEETRNRGGMQAGMPKVTIDAAIVDRLCVMAEALEKAEARVDELKQLAERLQHCAQGFYLDQGDYGHMEAIMQDYHAIMRGDATHPTDSGQGESQ